MLNLQEFYILSTTLTIFTIISSFFFLSRRFSRVNLYIYSILYSLSAITRPYDILAIDNFNVAEYLQSKDRWGLQESFSYPLIYYITKPFDDYRIKFFLLILISLLLIFIGIRRLINFFRTSDFHCKKWNIYTFLILLILPCISAVLYMIHLRQFLSFSIIIFLISFLINESKYNGFIFLFSTLGIIFTHPVYLIPVISILPFSGNSIISIKQIRYSFAFFYKYRNFFIIPIILTLLFFGYRVYLTLFSLLPTFQEYAYIRDVIIEENSSFFWFPLLLILITQLTSIKSYITFILNNQYFAIKQFSFNAINIYNFSLLLFILILLSLEIFAPGIYSIGRIKSAIYPTLFITVSLLAYERKKLIFYFNFFSIVVFSLSIFHSFYSRMIL